MTCKHGSTGIFCRECDYEIVEKEKYDIAFRAGAAAMREAAAKWVDNAPAVTIGANTHIESATVNVTGSKLRALPLPEAK